MFLLIGYVIVVGSVLGGFMMENGNPLMLWQPAELVIIVGAGLSLGHRPNTPRVCWGKA